MKKGWNLFLLLILIPMMGIASSCSSGDDENEDNGTGGGNNGEALEVKASKTSFTLLQENESDDAVTFTWNKGKITDRDVDYFFELDIAYNNFVTSVPVEQMANGVFSKTYKVSELNKLLIDYWKKQQTSSVELEARITAKIASGDYVKPETSTVKISVCSYIPEYTYNPYKAPLYWSPYEYNFVKDQYIPEDEWKKNIDWVAQNLAPYGYKMVSTDGWMSEDGSYNQDGYLDRHSVHWEHDYKYWSDYLKTKGMILGVYTNPLWIPESAAQKGYKIKGTNIPISNIVNFNEKTPGYRWVQIDRDGAEEWVKGYVKHFADMGVKYLRVDFLSWFENGYDRGFGQIGVERPHWIYETALRWMREECDKHGIFLSLVMPHLYNDAETEVKYGHMVRIGEDTGVGGWWKWSDNNRGVHQYGWSQYSNPFDGFIYFSRVSGRNKMILDGDFIRLNTYASTDEKQSVISINLVAGGPVTVSDQYNSIGSDLSLYQNEEMLDLNADGFVGKPLSNDPKNEKSSTWIGQMTNGDWIIALFNRETSNREHNIRFSDLGIDGTFKIRDLWTRTDVGTADSYSVTLRPRACKVIRLSENQ